MPASLWNKPEQADFRYASFFSQRDELGEAGGVRTKGDEVEFDRQADAKSLIERFEGKFLTAWHSS